MENGPVGGPFLYAHAAIIAKVGYCAVPLREQDMLKLLLCLPTERCLQIQGTETPTYSDKLSITNQ